MNPDTHALAAARRGRRPALLLAFAALLAVPAAAQFDPDNGQWGKDDPAHLRVMTWNVLDGIRTTASKTEGLNQWSALTRIVAGLKPDILILQETGDSAGGVDSKSELETVLDLFLHGGNDPWNGNAPVTSYVQLYDPSFDLPFIYASGISDGFNRNSMASRYPFADLNGDGKSQLDNNPFILPHLYSPGGNGGIRGWQIAEIDLPDGVYAGDIVIGNSHLKAGGDASDHNQRIAAAQNMAYYIDHLLNGAGTGIPDPFTKITDSPPVTSILDANTVMVTGGDWNEDEITNGTKGPAEWITRAEFTGGTDGTDKDQTDMVWDTAVDFFTGNDNTLGSSKLDYWSWPDSVASAANSFVFNSSTVPTAKLPPEVAGYSVLPTLASSQASDHRPVVVDLILPSSVCNDAVDLGNAHAGTGGLLPSFTVCGELSTGNTADFTLSDALPSTQVYIAFSFVQDPQPLFGGTLVPGAPFTLLGPFNTDATGTLAFTGIPGGGGPFDLYLQWIVVDAGASNGKSFSNALKVSWLP